MIASSAPAALVLTLPDGAERTVPAGTLAAEVVRSIGERLLQAAVAVSAGSQSASVFPWRSTSNFTPNCSSNGLFTYT